MKKLYFQISKTKNMDPADFNNDPRDEVEQMDVEEEMDVVEETALAVPAVGAELVRPGAFETLVAGVFEKVAMGVLTSVVQAEVKDVMVRYFIHIVI